MNKPRSVKVDNKIYEINSDFRVAIECDNIARDNSIGQHERALAIIYKLFGEKGLNCKNQNKIFELGMRFITLDNQKQNNAEETQKDYELDFNKCQGLISSSFKFDYKYDPYELEYLHWYDFYNDLQNLSNNEFGTCCILNRVMNLLNYDINEIKDSKEKKKIIDAKEEMIEKYCKKKEVELSKEQKESVSEFYKLIGIDI